MDLVCESLATQAFTSRLLRSIRLNVESVCSSIRLNDPAATGHATQQLAMPPTLEHMDSIFRFRAVSSGCDSSNV
ncbi:hypothetical protein N7451_001660 [Penicillium sp. IBT 35674x]|nr:hypothetical protein N7451_001660 [Penicillium sp. IBT 35674x]